MQLPGNGHVREGFVRNVEEEAEPAAMSTMSGAGAMLEASAAPSSTRSASTGAAEGSTSEGRRDAPAANSTSSSASLLAGVAGLLGGFGKSGSRAVAMAATKKQQ